MPGGPEYPVLGGVEYKHPLLPPTSSGAAATPTVTPDFIGSVTAVYTPTLNSLGFGVPFISSATVVNAPQIATSGTASFSVAGTYFWVAPAGTTVAHVKAYGGSGGGNPGGSGINAASAAGGGGGAYAERIAVPVTPGTVYTIVVGAAGTGASAPAIAGGDSTFVGDSSVQVVAAGGGGARGSLQSQNVGLGGTVAASTGDAGLVFAGGDGGAQAISSNAGGGGGGASGNNLATGAVGANSIGGNPAGQAGGTGANGGGSGGTGGASSANGIVGSAPGGGGGGGGAGNTTGGSGADGFVIINPPVQAPFITSVTVVYTPTLSAPVVLPSFITSTTTVHAPVVTSTEVDADFIDSVTQVYLPALFDTFAGNAVSQVSLEVVLAPIPPILVSQVTLEVIVPLSTGLHIWHRS